VPNLSCLGKDCRRPAQPKLLPNDLPQLESKPLLGVRPNILTTRPHPFRIPPVIDPFLRGYGLIGQVCTTVREVLQVNVCGILGRGPPREPFAFGGPRFVTMDASDANSREPPVMEPLPGAHRPGDMDPGSPAEAGYKAQSAVMASHQGHQLPSFQGPRDSRSDGMSWLTRPTSAGHQ
jgi:hypothetical protein